MFFEDAEGAGEEATEVFQVGLPEFLAFAIEGGLEEGVAGSPAVEGHAGDAQGFGDGGIGVAAEEEEDGFVVEGGEGEGVGGWGSGGVGRGCYRLSDLIVLKILWWR